MTVDLFERLLLLFPRFELINGSRDRRAADLLTAILGNLTPEMIAVMADRQNVEPYGPHPWKKTLTAGSDDHSGAYMATAFTKTPLASSVNEYLAYLRRGEHEADGDCGGSVLMGHAFYHIAYSYYQDRFVCGNKGGKPTLMGQLFERLLKTSSEKSSRWSLRGFAKRFFVSRHLSRLSETERQLVVLTSIDKPPKTKIDLKNFQPVGTFPMPEYESQMLAFPPFLEIFEYIERHRFNELIISTPGPMGVTGLAAARLLGLRTTGIYHTDFVQYVRQLTQDDDLADLTGQYMRWFYDQCTTILVPTETYRRQLIDNGFEPSKIGVMARGVDNQLFHPSKAVPTFFDRFGPPNHFCFLYVGRISKEKNIDALIDAFDDVVRRGYQARLVFVGEGPCRQRLAARCQERTIAFTGILEGEELAQAYASGDCMVFPSTTDTFGNVVLEAQSCGLPVIVTDQGGPADIVRRYDSGIVVDLSQPRALADAMEKMMLDADLRGRLRNRGLLNAAESKWENVLEQFWSRDGCESGETDMETYRSLDARNAPGVIAMEVA